MNRASILVFSGVAAFASWSAHADNCATDTCVTYNLSPNVFNDGGSVFGSITYDATNGTVDAFDLTSTAGDLLQGRTYTQENTAEGGYLASNTSFFFGTPGISALAIYLSGNGLNDGIPSTGPVTVPIIDGEESASTFPGEAEREFEGGSLTPVPLPSTLWTLLGGLALIGCTKRAAGEREIRSKAFETGLDHVCGA
jgi:hypothetical protein